MWVLTSPVYEAKLYLWPVKRLFLHIPMSKPVPREEGGLSEAAFEQWLEAQSLGLWPETEGYEDAPPSEE